MCQLLGMNCNTPTDILFSFEGFHRRGGLTDHHVDGWGIAFFEEAGVRLFIDNQPSAESPVANLVRQYPIHSENVIAHIRKATIGKVKLTNCHPFMREIWGQYWIFAHNGDLHNYIAPQGQYYRPVGDTDSETVFCHLLESMRQTWDQCPSEAELFTHIEAFAKTITPLGTFNFMLSNGKMLFSHCSTKLHYIIRQAPFNTAHLVDEDLSIDFTSVTTPKDRVAVIATEPLTDNEIWTQCEPNQLLLFKDGSVAIQSSSL